MSYAFYALCDVTSQKLSRLQSNTAMRFVHKVTRTLPLHYQTVMLGC